MKAEMFDKVRTRTGLIGYIVEIYDGGKAYEVDIEPYDKNRDFPTETLKEEDIIEVLK